MLFTGSYTALLTPFKNGVVDYDSYRKLVDFQIDNGSHGLVPVGTTGESPTLSHEEHKKVIEISEIIAKVPYEPVIIFDKSLSFLKSGENKNK